MSKHNRVALSIAHCPADQGAKACGTTEHIESGIWTGLVQQFLEEKGVEVFVVPVGGLTKKVRAVNEANCALAVEIHFNSSVSKAAKGCETLFCPGSTKGAKAADIVQRHLVVAMCNPDRGIKEGWYRMDKPGVVDYLGDVDGDESLDYFLKATNCPAIIVEPEFIHRMDVIADKRGEGAMAITDGIIEALKELRP